MNEVSFTRVTRLFLFLFLVIVLQNLCYYQNDPTLFSWAELHWLCFSGLISNSSLNSDGLKLIISEIVLSGLSLFIVSLENLIFSHKLFYTEKYLEI